MDAEEIDLSARHTIHVRCSLLKKDDILGMTVVLKKSLVKDTQSKNAGCSGGLKKQAGINKYTFMCFYLEHFSSRHIIQNDLTE